MLSAHWVHLWLHVRLPLSADPLWGSLNASNTHATLVFSSSRTSLMANKQASEPRSSWWRPGLPTPPLLTLSSSCHYRSTNSGLSCGSQLSLTHMTLLTSRVSSISKTDLKPGHFPTPPLLLSCLCRHHPGTCPSPSLYPTQQPARAFKKQGLSCQSSG